MKKLSGFGFMFLLLALFMTAALSSCRQQDKESTVEVRSEPLIEADSMLMKPYDLYGYKVPE